MRIFGFAQRPLSQCFHGLAWVIRPYISWLVFHLCTILFLMLALREGCFTSFNEPCSIWSWSEAPWSLFLASGSHKAKVWHHWSTSQGCIKWNFSYDLFSTGGGTSFNASFDRPGYSRRTLESGEREFKAGVTATAWNYVPGSKKKVHLRQHAVSTSSLHSYQFFFQPRVFTHSSNLYSALRFADGLLRRGLESRIEQRVISSLPRWSRTFEN